MEKVVLTREQIADLCPACAEQMAERGVKALKLEVIDPASSDVGPTLKFYSATAGELHVYAGFSQGLCDKFAPDEGMFTRCAEAMSGKVDDENAFCAALHKFCVGKWPGEKGYAQDHENVIKDVEIFASGTHNGDEYKEHDLDDIVAAFKELDYRPAIKIGHTKDATGAPAYGWVTNLRKVGTKLVADFESMHDSVVEALRNKSYDRVSSEIYFNLNRGGKLFRRALKAVALLGAEVPAVAKLVPLHRMEFAEGAEFEAAYAYDQQLEVTDDSLRAALAARVSSLEDQLKEYDMAKNVEKVAELKAKVAEFRKKMDEMKKKHGKEKDEDMMDDEVYTQLSADVKAVADEIATLEAADEAEGLAELRQQLTAEKAARTASEAREKVLAQRVDRIEQKERVLILGDKIKACKVPAFRPGLEALYAYALEHGDARVKVYSTDKDGKTQTADSALTDVIDGVVAEINRKSEQLFKALAYSGAPRRVEGVPEDENPSIEIEKRVREFRGKHPEVKQYEVALKAVMAADAELAQRYRDQVARGSTEQ